MKKIPGWLPTAATVLAVSVSSQMLLPAATAENAPVLTVDQDLNNTAVQKTLHISGTASNASEVNYVCVNIGGQSFWTNATLDSTVSPADGFSAGETVKYSLDLDVSALAAGKYTVNVAARGKDDTLTQQAFVVDMNEVKAPDPQLSFDRDLEGTNAYGTLSLSGTASNASGVDYVCANIDGQANWQNAILDTAVTPADGFSDGETAKYSLKLDLSALSAGEHTINVAARGKDETLVQKSFTIHVMGTEPQLSLDKGLDGANAYGGITISGEASHISGVQYVCINTDGQNNWKNATLEKKDTPAEGFLAGDTVQYSLNLDISSLAPGDHTLEVASRGNDETVVTKFFTIHVVNTAPQLSVDKNWNGANVHGTLSLSGVASNVSGLDYVCVNTDGQNNWQNAALTQTTAADGFPDGGTDKYHLDVDLSSLPEGDHTLNIAARGKDGSLTQKSFTVHVVNTAPELSLDKNMDGANVYGTLSLSGTASNVSGLDYVCVNTDGQSNWQNAEMSPTTTAAGFPDGDTIKYGIKLDVSSLSTGNHAICVAARGKDGTAIMKSFTVHVVNTAPQLTVDQNLNNMDTYGTLSLSGTASNISGLAYVCVNTDGQNNWQNATLTQTAAAAGFPDGGTEKYALKLDLSSLSEGNHLITIAARGNDDHLVMQNYTIHVVKTDPQITLDQDIDGKNASGTLTLSGTASNNSGIDYVCVNTDGQNNWQNATLTQATAADGFGDGDTVKYSLNLDTSTLSAGTHSIWISARGKDGSSVTKSLTVKIASKEPEITINQSPDGTEVNGAVALSGTASNSSGMDYVCVNTDGQNNWTNANLTSTTPADGFADGDTVNYNLTLDVSSLSLGTHSIWIAARGKDGTTVMKSLVVYVRNTEDHISLDQNMANASIGDTLDFSGIALDNAGVQNVILNIDGVNAWYSPVELADDSAMGNGIVERFHFSVDTSGLSAGAHSVTLLVNKKDGSQGDRFFFQVQKKGAGLTIDQAENSTLNLNGATLSGQVDDVSSLSQLTARSDDKQLLGTLAASQLSSGKFSFTLPHLTPGPHLITFDLHTKSGADIQVDRQFIAGGTVNQASYSFSESAFAAKNKSYVAGYEKYGVRAMQDADINPSAIMDTEDGPYEMMALDFSAFQTADRATLIDGLNHLLSGCGVLNGKGEAFYEAGKASDVNPIYLVAHARIESGNGSSYLSTGRSPTDGHATGCYNQFGINAYDADPRNGNSYAMQQGWTTVDKSIYGGAQWIAEHYIHNSQHGGSYDQNTLYEMRWNPEGYQMHGYLCYQYATEPDWAASIAAIANSYPSIFNGISLHFIYPVYQ